MHPPPTSPLRYPTVKDQNWEYMHQTEVYMPMLSVSDFSASDLKLHEQWIVKRKRIIYFLTILTVIAVCLCAVSVIYVIPRIWGDNLVAVEVSSPPKVQVDHQPSVNTINNFFVDSSDVFEESNGGNVGFPTLQAEDIQAFLVPSIANNDNYTYCVMSAHTESIQLTKRCNAVIIWEMNMADPTEHLAAANLTLEDVIYVRISSTLSEATVKKIADLFPNVEKLAISVDKLCYGQEEKDKSKLPIVRLPELITLELVNATLCPMTTTAWVLDKWDMPVLEMLTVNQADIPKPLFDHLTDFIDRHNETLTSLQFTNCYFGDCNFSQVDKYNLNITEIDRRDQNSF